MYQLRTCNSYVLCYSDGTSTEENIAKIMTFAWLIPPCGILLTVAACGVVFWNKGLSFSDPYGQAILINGRLLYILFSFRKICLVAVAASLCLWRFSHIICYDYSFKNYLWIRHMFGFQVHLWFVTHQYCFSTFITRIVDGWKS